MRWVELVKLGRAGYTSADVDIPYNGEIFEFLATEWRELARRAAATEGGVVREGDMVARVYELNK